MPVALIRLQQTLDEILAPQLFRDYAPNGLQVQGREQVSRLAAPTRVGDFVERVARALSRTPLHEGDPDREVQRIA
jgi:putative NIF3 family GTP cyclohydrolase 1 type 2